MVSWYGNTAGNSANDAHGMGSPDSLCHRNNCNFIIAGTDNTRSICRNYLLYVHNPDLKKLKSPPFKIGFSAILVAALIAGTVHAYRFIPSPEANIPISIPMALLLMAAEYSICILLIYLLWRK
jgi:hypothetical protein